MVNYLWIGGVSYKVIVGFVECLDEVFEVFRFWFVEYDCLLLSNCVFN